MQNFLQQLIEQLPDQSKYILYEGLQYSTQAKIYEAMLRLEQDVISKVLNSKGKDSEEYKFFMLIKNILYQAGEGDYMIEQYKADNNIMRQLNEFLLKRNAMLENELAKYRTIEELKADGALQIYIERVTDSMKDKYQFDKKQANQ